MIPPKVKKDLLDAVRKRMAEMDSALSVKMAATQSVLAARGLVISAVMMQSLAEDATESLKERANFIIWQFIRRLGTHLTPANLAETSELFRITVDGQIQSIRARLQSFPLFAEPAFGDVRSALEFQFERQGRGLTSRLVSELRFATKAQEELPFSTPIATVNAPIALVPTLPEPVPQSPPAPRFNPGTRQQIVQALQLYLEEMEKPESAHIARGHELHELIRETKLELEKPQPNNLKVNTNLRAIAETTKFVGSLSPAYQILLTFLAFTHRNV